MVILISVKWQIEFFGKSLSRKIRYKITLAEDDKILSQDAEIAKTFNEYFYKYPSFKYAKQSEFLYTNAFS